VRAGLVLAAMAFTVAACANSSPREQTIDAVGTPFFLVFKIPVCVATVAIAAPLGGLVGLADPSPNAAEQDVLADLDYGLRRNCGPPYTLTPSS
jgi:hypothetical protein